MKWVGMLVLALGGVVGCANLTSVTSGQIGCPPEEIQILEEDSGWNTKTWVAECRGKRFHCTEVSAGNSAQFDCTEEAAETGIAPEPGCEFDTQCKGDRICEQGNCISP